MDSLKIKEWLSDGRGYGHGNGNGRGYGNGYGIKTVDGLELFNVDDMKTAITHIHGNIAKGFYLYHNTELKPCYIAKGGGYFAHGETIEAANNALQEKIFESLDADEAIQKFSESFKSDTKYPVSDFYKWHHILTGSCEMGRKAFAEEHGINIEKDEMTVAEFIALTENSFGGEIIKKLKNQWRTKYERKEM